VGRGVAALACAAALLSAAPAAAQDPLEGVNRRIHAFNRLAQAHALGPAAEAYHAYTTPGQRRAVANLFANLREPVTAASALAAGETGTALNAARRFAINTTLGRAGTEDRAEALGHPPRPFTLADAACAWGLPAGPYLVLPLLGPSTLRDAAALAATGAALQGLVGPEAWLGLSTGEALVAYAGLHAELNRVEAQSLDAYAVIRSAYLQGRASMCPADRVPGDADPAEDAP